MVDFLHYRDLPEKTSTEFDLGAITTISFDVSTDVYKVKLSELKDVLFAESSSGELISAALSAGSGTETESQGTIIRTSPGSFVYDLTSEIDSSNIWIGDSIRVGAKTSVVVDMSRSNGTVVLDSSNSWDTQQSFFIVKAPIKVGYTETKTDFAVTTSNILFGSPVEFKNTFTIMPGGSINFASGNTIEFENELRINKEGSVFAILGLDGGISTVDTDLGLTVSSNGSSRMKILPDDLIFSNANQLYTENVGYINLQTTSGNLISVDSSGVSAFSNNIIINPVAAEGNVVIAGPTENIAYLGQGGQSYVKTESILFEGPSGTTYFKSKHDVVDFECSSFKITQLAKTLELNNGYLNINSENIESNLDSFIFAGQSGQVLSLANYSSALISDAISMESSGPISIDSSGSITIKTPDLYLDAESTIKLHTSRPISLENNFVFTGSGSHQVSSDSLELITVNNLTLQSTSGSVDVSGDTVDITATDVGIDATNITVNASGAIVLPDASPEINFTSLSGAPIVSSNFGFVLSNGSPMQPLSVQSQNIEVISNNVSVAATTIDASSATLTVDTLIASNLDIDFDPLTLKTLNFSADSPLENSLNISGTQDFINLSKGGLSSGILKIAPSEIAVHSTGALNTQSASSSMVTTTAKEAIKFGSDGIVSMPSQPSLILKTGATTQYTAAPLETYVFNSTFLDIVGTDTTSMWTPGTGNVLVPQSGIYIISINFAGLASGGKADFDLSVKVNGVTEYNYNATTDDVEYPGKGFSSAFSFSAGENITFVMTNIDNAESITLTEARLTMVKVS